jgi:hypothetical protein
LIWQSFSAFWLWRKVQRNGVRLPLLSQPLSQQQQMLSTGGGKY